MEKKWACNNCDSIEYTSLTSSLDVQKLKCLSCGGLEFTLKQIDSKKLMIIDINKILNDGLLTASSYALLAWLVR